MGFFQDFMGSSARKDIENANRQSKNYLTTGYNEASGIAGRAGEQAQTYLKPGLQGQEMYANSLGLNGAQGGQNALMAYQQGRNPYLDYQQNQAQQGIDRMANARGSLNSGGNALAAARARTELGYKDYSGWQDRLGQMGGQAAQQASTLAQQQGQYLGDLRSGYGQQMAGNEINYGNAMASARNIGINNIIGVVGAAGRAASAAAGGGK